MTRMTEVVERFMAAGTMAKVYEVAGGPVVFGSAVDSIHDQKSGSPESLATRAFAGF